MRNDKLYLIYVNKVGMNHKGDGLYEFIFTHEPYKVDMESWGWLERPASTYAQPPTEEYIHKVLNLKISRFQFTVLHEQILFTYMDGFDKVVALAWEDDTDNEELENDAVDRLVFHYGDTLETVNDKLYAREIVLRD